MCDYIKTACQALLKGPKHDQVGYEFFYIKQACIWLGDLGTGEKNYFYFYLGKIFAILYF